MKVLIVSPVPLFPCNAGNRARIKELAGAVRLSGHELHFAFLGLAESPEYGDKAAHIDFFGAERVIWLTVNDFAGRVWAKVRRGCRRVREILGGDVRYLVAVDDWFMPGQLDRLRALHAACQFDVVIVEYVFASKALEAFQGPVRKIIDTHDIFANRHTYYLHRGQKPGWFSTTVEEENKGLERAHAVLAIQKSEAVALQARLKRDAPAVEVVSHFLSLSPPRAQKDGVSAGYLASSNSINVDALRFFISEVLDLVVSQIPQFVLRVAGAVCDHIGDHPRVEKMGLVGETRELLDNVSVFVNPVLMGTGINIKLLEALAHGVPVVTTTTGARGLFDTAEAVSVVADADARAFADEVVRLLSLGEGPSLAAYRYAASWDAQQREALTAVLNG